MREFIAGLIVGGGGMGIAMFIYRAKLVREINRVKKQVEDATDAIKG